MLHAILRLVLLGLNVLDSFKIIKPPKVRNGQPGPSARALTARKRAMKGMMCVWVVSVSCCPARMKFYFGPTDANLPALGMLVVSREDMRPHSDISDAIL